MHRPGTCSEDHDATCSKGDACAKTFFQRSCYPDNLAWVCWTCTHKCSVLRSAINSDDFSPGSASGRASIALRRPAKAKPVSYWLKLAAEVCSRCSPQLCWFACGNDNTNASYSGRTARHPGPRRCAPRAGIRRSCPHTRVVLSTSTPEQSHPVKPLLPTRPLPPIVDRSLGDLSVNHLPCHLWVKLVWVKEERKELLQECMVKNEEIEDDGKDVLVSTPAMLSSLACDALRRHMFTQVTTITEQRESTSVIKDADLSAKPSATLPATFSQPFLRWVSKNPGKIKFYTSLPTPGFFTQIMEFCADPLRGLHVRPGDRSTGWR